MDWDLIQRAVLTVSCPVLEAVMAETRVQASLMLVQDGVDLENARWCEVV